MGKAEVRRWFFKPDSPSKSVGAGTSDRRKNVRFEDRLYVPAPAVVFSGERWCVFLRRVTICVQQQVTMAIKTIEGQLSAKGLKFALVVSRFNSIITERLLAGALDALVRTGCDPDDIAIVKVPGSWELPLAARELTRQKRYDAVICLSAVVRGDTPHFDYIATEAAKGLGQTALESGVPVSFGVLTCDTLEQAIDRAGAKSGNKGFDAAMTAIEMGNLMRQLKDGV